VSFDAANVAVSAKSPAVEIAPINRRMSINILHADVPQRSAAAPAAQMPVKIEVSSTVCVTNNELLSNRGEKKLSEVFAQPLSRPFNSCKL
jgi:hypothetical protein